MPGSGYVPNCVVDYDAGGFCYYAPVDLDEPNVLIQDGLAPSEADPQQMMSAVISKVLENIDLRHSASFISSGIGSPDNVFLLRLESRKVLLCIKQTNSV